MKCRKIARRQRRSTATSPANMEVLRNVEAIRSRNRASIDGMNHGDGRGRICPTPLSKEATPIVRDPFANGSPPGDCRPRSPGGRGLLYPNWSMTRNDAPRMSTYVEVDGDGKAVGCGVRCQHSDVILEIDRYRLNGDACRFISQIAVNLLTFSRANPGPADLRTSEVQQEGRPSQCAVRDGSQPSFRTERTSRLAHTPLLSICRAARSFCRRR